MDFFLEAGFEGFYPFFRGGLGSKGRGGKRGVRDCD